MNKRLYLSVSEKAVRRHYWLQMRRAGQALAELNGQQKAVALGGSSKARYREAQVGAANECARRLESNSLSEVQDQIAVLQQQLEIDHQVQEVVHWGASIQPNVVSCKHSRCR